MKLSKPTQVTAFAYTVLLCAVTLPCCGASYNLKERVSAFLGMLLPMAMSLYSLNCMMVGDCKMWAWYNAVLISAWCFMVTVIVLKRKEKLNLKQS